jgi:hypothetical protein
MMRSERREFIVNLHFPLLLQLLPEQQMRQEYGQRPSLLLW